jgi:hypothetical protein
MSGTERVEKFQWMKPGGVVLIYVEMSDRNAVYAHQIEWLSKPERVPGKNDTFLAGMPQTLKH